jgi:hypothetical protein
MKNFIILTLSFCSILLLQSCSKTSVCCEPVDELPTRPLEFAPKNYERMSFNNLKVGQISLFDRTIIQNWNKDSSSFEKNTDTLQLKVIDQDSNGFKIETHIINQRNYYDYFYVKIIGDSLYINPTIKGRLFFGGLFLYYKFAYPLTENRLVKWNTNRWIIPQKVVFGKSFGYVENAVINGVKYNKIIGSYDDSSTPSDGPISIYFYSKEKGFIGIYDLATFLGHDGDLWNLIP